MSAGVDPRTRPERAARYCSSDSAVILTFHEGDAIDVNLEDYH